MNRKGILGLFLIGILAVIPLISYIGHYSSLGKEFESQTIIDIESIEVKTHSPSFELHNRISISDDLDWDEQGILGSGTEQDPYVIENLEINDNYDCISIIYTSKHYVIRNCLLRSDSIQGVGIHINHADKGRVENCTVMMKSYGVYVMNTNGLVISNNTMYNLSRHGIRLSSSSYCNITHNVIYDTLDRGIYCQSSNCRIDNNTIWNSYEEALYMLSCSSSEITFNTFWNSSSGTYLESCDFITITNNSFNENRELGFRIYDSDNLLFANNSIRDNNGYGVHWNRGDDAIIVHNHISGNSHFGFYLYYARNCTLSSNVFENDGLVLTGGDILDYKHTVSDNIANGKILGYFFNSIDMTLEGNSYGQILAVNCSGLVVQDGTLPQTDTGIAFYYSSNCTVNSTTVSNQMRGIYLYESDFCNIIATTLENCGVYISGFAANNWVHNFTGTTVNGKPIGYFYQESDVTLDDDSLGQIIVVNSTRFLIKDYEIMKATMGLALAYSTDCNISENMLMDNHIGLMLQECSNCEFINNTIQNSTSAAFLSYFSTDCRLKNVTIQDSGYGLYLYSCTDFTINESRSSSNNYGAYLRDSARLNFSHCTFDYNYEAFYTYYYDNSTIFDCDVLFSLSYGYRLYYSDWIVIHGGTTKNNGNHGIYCMSSTYGEIIGNAVVQNGADGISLFHGGHYQLINNTVEGNAAYGINLYVFTDYNTVFGNNFSSNHDGNGYGYQATNTWDDGVSIGNYWDDYHGPGTYPIPGPGNNEDRYPRGPAVVLTSHTDESYQLESVGVTFTWNSFSTEPDYYIVYLEGLVHAEGVWDGLGISVDVVTSSLGIFNYTLFINGTSGAYKIDTVLVTIYDNNPTINSPPDIGYNFDTTGHTIIWSPTDLNPFGYYVYLNDGLHESGIWAGLTIQVDINGLPIGTYNFTLLVNDTSGNSVSDSVQVTVWDTVPYLSSPDDITYEVGTSDLEIFWDASDFNPANYTVYLNSTIDYAAPWNGNPIWYNIEGLDVGVYNYTIILEDTSGQAVSDTVFVFVIPASTTTLTTTETSTTTPTQPESLILLTIIGVSAIIIIVVIILIFKKRT